VGVLGGAKDRRWAVEARVRRQRESPEESSQAKQGRDRRGRNGLGTDKENRGNQFHYEESRYGTVQRGRWWCGATRSTSTQSAR
jgi:hypothetical protein